MNATTENACTKTVADEIWFQDISVYEAIHPLIKLLYFLVKTFSNFVIVTMYH